MWCKLEDVTSVIGDGLHGTPQYNPNGAYYFVNGNNLFNRQIIIKNNTKRVSEEEYMKYKKPLNEHTILVSINGTIGNIGTYSNEQIILGKSACYFNITPFLVKEYMCYVIESNYFQKYALLSAIGSTIKNVPLKAIYEFYVPIPPVSEQKRIVSETDYLLAFINKVEEGKENLQNTVQSAKSKILDLAIHGKLVPQDPNDEPASELLKRINPKAEITCDTPQYGKLPKGWCLCKISSVVDIVNGKSQKNVESPTGKYPIYGSGGIIGKAMEYTCLAGSTIIGRKGTINHPIFVEENFWNVDTAFGMKANNQILEDKYFYCFCLYFDFSKLDKSSALPSLTKTVIGNLILPIPPLAEQQRIVAKIEELFSQLDKIESSLQA